MVAERDGRWPDDTEIIEDVDNVRYRWWVNDYSARVDAFAISGGDSVDADGRFTGSLLLGEGPDFVDNIDDAEPTIHAFVKWDGCTDIQLGDMHWCGLESYRQHVATVRYIYRRAQELIPKADPAMFGPWKD